MTTTRLTAEEILAQFPNEIAADARAFAHTSSDQRDGTADLRENDTDFPLPG